MGQIVPPCVIRLVIDRTETRKIGPGVYEVDAWVSNAGFLPTYVSEKAKALGVAKQVTVCIDVPQQDLVNCSAAQEIGDLSSYGLAPTGEWHYGNISTGNGPAVTKKVSWIVKGKRGPVTVTASCPRAGTQRAAVDIG